MKEYFDTKQEAAEYKLLHELHQREPIYIAVRGKWALTFPIKAINSKGEYIEK